MTLEEKAAQLCGDLPMFVAMGGISDEVMREKYPHGHGRFTQFSMLGLMSAGQIAHMANQIQKYFVEGTRLGIPVAFQSENLCGYPAAGGTLFPSMTNVAATWEPELAEKMSEIIGEESRAVGITSAMSPVVDVSRDPRWGRTYETFGEDPYLISQMGVSYIKGMQKDKTDGVACIAKHFLGYSETQGGLNTAVSRITDRELYEVFATPFEAAAREADVSGMMASYSEIDGLPVGMNPKVARDLLRDTMGFRGMLTSDGAGVMKMYNQYKVASSYEEAGYLAKKAGLDTEIPVGNAFKKLPDYVREGKLDESVLDESVRRILTIKFEYGLFEHPYVEETEVAAHMTNASKRELADEMAEKSLVLLKNDGVVPLKEGMRLAVVGPHADSLRDPVSGYTYPAYIEMMEAGRQGMNTGFNGMADEAQKAKAEGGDNLYATMDIGSNANAGSDMEAGGSSSGMDSASAMERVLRGMGATSLKEELEKRFSICHAKGCSILGEDMSGIDEAVEAARESDVVVMAVGGNCGWVNTTGGEGRDRCRLGLPGVQQQLLEAVAAVGKPVVLVLYGPGIFALPWAVEHVAAMVQAWMPGVGAGRAVAKALSGESNPGGKLPVTIPRSVGQVPVVYNQRMGSGYQGKGAKVGEVTDAFGQGQESELAGAADIFNVKYVDGEISPLFSFGFGLSYTTFALSDFEILQKEVATSGEFAVRCNVKNTGGREGDEVVQLYTRFCDAHVVRPVKQLAGFMRVHLNPGEQKNVTFEIKCAQLGYYNEDMRFVVEPGRLEVMVGNSADNLSFAGDVVLTGATEEVLHKRSYTSQVTVE
jgi:beta-glucosidase